MQIKIQDFADVQTWQERFHIPFTASITGWLVAVLNNFELEGEKEVEVEISDLVLPVSYRSNPWAWLSNSLIKKVKYPNVQTFRHNSATVVLANFRVKVPHGFYKSLVARLQKSDTVSVNYFSVPFSYQDNPYVLQWRLRKIFPSLKMTNQQTKLVFTHDEN